VTLLMPVGTWTIRIGSYAYTMDVYKRYWPPREGLVDAAATENTKFWNGPWPTNNQPPGPANNWRRGSAYQNPGSKDNGYSQVPDSAPATSTVYCVAPGDQGWLPSGKATADTRSEPNDTDTYSLLAPDSPTGGIDTFGNSSLTVRFYRVDWEIPATWTAPVVVRNDTPAWTAYNAGFGRVVWPNGAVNPTTGSARSASAVVTNTKATVASLSNLVENQGPAVFVWAGGTNGGTSGQTQFRFQPISLGVGLKDLPLDTLDVVFGPSSAAAAAKDPSRVSTIVEYQPDLYATTNGKPWTAAPGTSVPGTSQPWSPTNTVYPYGVPPGVPGGGYLRIWRLINNVWTCVTAGNTFAVPGTPTIVNRRIVGDPTTGANAGKIFGPTLKVNGAALAAGPQGSSGTVLGAVQAAPFDISVGNILLPTEFRPQGGEVLVGTERMKFSTYNASTKTLQIVARAQRGTSAVAHVTNEQVAGTIEFNVLSSGINQGASVPTPFAAREWPILVGPTFSSVSGAPSISYP
jgi:hypothetical protein